MNRTHRLLGVTLLLAVTTLAPMQDPASPEWADADSATIRPGAQARTVDTATGCTSNFVFYTYTTDTDVETYPIGGIFLGLAAHCVAEDQVGGSLCEFPPLPPGSEVAVEGAEHMATVAYSSIATMRTVDEQDPTTCQSNDFALVRLDPADWNRINPTLLHFGGPTGVSRDGTSIGDVLYSYQGGSNQSLLHESQPATHATYPKRGVSFGTTREGWLHNHYLVTPGIPGDSGSGYVDEDGRAIGVLSSLELATYAGSNNAIDLHKAMEYARAHDPGLETLTLATGTEPFDGSVRPPSP